MHRFSTDIADGTTPRGVDLVEYEEFLATPGRGKRRRNRCQLEMPQDTRDHRLLGDDGNEVQGAPAAKRTGAHIQPKDAAQQLGPRPVRGARGRLLSVQPLLARGGTDRPTQAAVRCEAARMVENLSCLYPIEVAQGKCILDRMITSQPLP